MTDSDFEAIQVLRPVINVRRRGKKTGEIKIQEIRITDESLINLVTALRELIESLVHSEGSWKNNNNQYLMTLVTESMKVVKGYKYLSITDKRDLLMVIIEEIVEKEIETSEIKDDIKEKLLTGIEEIVEPAIELGIRALKGELKTGKGSVMSFLGLIVSAFFICSKKSETQ